MESLSEHILQSFIDRRSTADTSGSDSPSSPSDDQLPSPLQGPETTEQFRRRPVYNRRVSKLSALLAEALGQPPEWQDRIEEAACLHDLGKLWVAKEILDKPGPLTEEEYEEVKKHTLVGAALLSQGTSELVRMAGRIARSHHERWDGEGYPDGLEGEEIPLSARIVAVADAFDAMTQDRPYREALSVEEAFHVLDEEAGAQFDPQVSEAALRRRDEVAALV